jgi:hypothetical protein
MKTSEAIDQIATALAVAQSKMKAAVKDSTNPAFKSKYADLTSVWEACREALTANGISAIQDVARPNGHVEVTTRLLHKSGQWLEFGPLSMPIDKPNAHGVGSATSYARRYALSAAVGVVQDDDDGNAAASVDTKPADAPAMKNKLAAVTSATKEPAPPARDWTAEARIIFKKMSDAKNQDARDLILSDKADVLKEIQKHNPTAHTEIMKISTGKEAA